MNKIINIEYEWTDKLDKTKEWLKNIPSVFACDFETSSKYSEKTKETFKKELANSLNNPNNFLKQKELQNKINSSGLSHPSYCYITHFSFAYTINKAKVIVFFNKEVLKEVLTYLIKTDNKQIWHNALFDFKHIYFHTNAFPKNYEDTQLLIKSIRNHKNNMKSKVGLKELMGSAYGAWGISSDHFNTEEMYNEEVIKYAGIDACATYNLWVKYGNL